MFPVLTRTDLLAHGHTSRMITRAVRAGELIRCRNGIYTLPTAPEVLARALRVGGRLGCVSLLALLGVFVFDDSALHVHVARGASRLRGDGTPGSRPHALATRAERGALRLHWHPLVEPPDVGVVHIVDAVIHAVRCQTPRHAVATLDSAVHLGLLTLDQMGEVFEALPARFQVLRALIDGRAESGPETLVRLMALALGCRVELQVPIDGVGRVDLLIDGWLVVECDSKQFHSDWRQQIRDYERDRVLAEQGYSRLRLLAADILYRPERVIASLRGLLQHCRYAH